MSDRWGGDAQFALANPLGGIAIQTVWLAIANLLYRRSNLEHAAASLENILQSLVLVALLCIPVIAYATPTLQIGWIHPSTLAIPLFYLYGLHLLRRLRREPVWEAKQTSETRRDEPDESDDDGTSTARLWWRLAALAAAVAATGYLIGQGGLGVVAATGLPSGLGGVPMGFVKLRGGVRPPVSPGTGCWCAAWRGGRRRGVGRGR